ncbi:MAG TPA: hypothetical protein VH041_12600 [Caldimonas sp.]|nr:hypothetical protein [Caldimonas sp.]HEX4235133.1 hypothetical protein [Caldimonas sp.]
MSVSQPIAASVLRGAGAMLSTLALLVLSACGGDDFSPLAGATPGPTPTGAGVTGTAYLGPISGATASLFNVNPNGTNTGAAVETVTTTATGFAFNTSITGPARVCVSGGTYVDEATNTTQTNTLTLCALVGVATTQVFITPMSSFVDEIVKRQLALLPNPTTADFTTTLGAANTLIETVYNVTAPVDTLNPLFGQTDATAHPDQYKLGAVLGAYSQLIADYLARCGGDRHEVLRALLADIGDKVFDGKTIDATGAIQTVQYTCNGVAVNLPIGAGTADVVTALTEFAGTALGTTMDLNGNRTVIDTVKANIIGGPAAPAAIKTLPSQGLIAIDTIHNVGYVPIYTKDASGNGQIAVVDLTVGVANPIITLVSLPGTSTAIASNFFADNGRVYVLAANGSALTVHVIKASDNTVEFSVACTGLDFSGSFGGVIVDGKRNHVVVAGTDTIGLLDISTATPTWITTSVINVPGTDSFSLNSETGLVFVSSDGQKFTVDTTVTPMTQRGYSASLGTTDGVAFDSLTGMMVITPEFEDKAYVINMNELPATGTGPAPTLSVPGIGTTPPVGEGPGGQVAVNVLTHQALVADEFGQNLRLVQMPTATITGAADATNAFTIAATLIPKPSINGTPTQLGMRGDPNSVTIDPARNFGYVLADTQPSFHGFNVNFPLFLIRVDLSAPGTAPNATWAPTMQAIQMP